MRNSELVNEDNMRRVSAERAKKGGRLSAIAD